MTIRGVSTREELILALEHQILSGQLKPGSLLPSERQLSENHSVSRSGVREALRVLAERRLVSVKHGRGTFVADPDSGAAAAAIGNALRRENITARDVIVGRTVVEKEAAALAATVRTDEDLERMDRILVLLDPRSAILDVVRADLSFHLALVRGSHNPIFEAMFRAISGFTAELMLRSLSDEGVAEIAVPQHREILRAVRDGDSTAARALVNAHMEVAVNHYGADLDRSLDAVAERELGRLFGPERSLNDIWDVAARE